MILATRPGAAADVAFDPDTFRTAMEALPVGVLLTTSTGEWANAELRRIWGRAGHDRITAALFDESLEALEGPVRSMQGDGLSARGPIALALDGTTTAPKRHRLMSTDGRTIVVLVAAAPLGSAGRSESAVAVATDVTSRHDVERLRDAFLGILGHELRTPVTSIVGAAELLRSDGLAPEVRRDVAETLVEEAHRVHRLVEQLIDLARLDRSGVTSDEPIHLVHLARRVIGRERTRFPTLTLDLVADRQVVPAMGTEGYVIQVLTILVDNAAKFSGKNGRVTVRVAAEADEVAVHVLDNGPGLPAADRDAIFRLFQRGPASGPTDAPGLGIGLFVARAIIEAMGGRIWAEDRPEGGADVGFALPAITD